MNKMTSPTRSNMLSENVLHLQNEYGRIVVNGHKNKKQNSFAFRSESKIKI